jgi:hypothetical protein
MMQLVVDEWFLAVSVGTSVFGASLLHGFDQPFWLAGGAHRLHDRDTGGTSLVLLLLTLAVSVIDFLERTHQSPSGAVHVVLSWPF